MNVNVVTENRNRILAQLQTITDLPTLPTVFLKVMRMMRSSDTPISEIAKVVESDPAISMKILKLVNSSFYGLSRTVESVQQSIVLLGFSTLKNIIVSVSIFKAVGSEESESDFDRRAFWQHSIGCGCFARFLEKRLEKGNTEEAFISGIIHDIGKIVLDRYYRDDLNAVLRAVRQDNISFYQAEREILGTSHTEIGSFLADYWHVPAKFVEVIARHHTFDPESENADITAIVHLADVLAHRYQLGFSGNPAPPKVNPAVFECLNINEDMLKLWDDDLRAEIETSKDLLDSMLQ